MARIKLEFDNADGQALAGLLETPPDGVPVARYAVCPLLHLRQGPCTSMTLRMYANRKKLNLEDIQVRLHHDRVYLDDCLSCEEGYGRVDRITRTLALEGDLTGEQRQRLIEIADRCPVHQTLEKEVRIETTAGEAVVRIRDQDNTRRLTPSTSR